MDQDFNHNLDLNHDHNHNGTPRSPRRLTKQPPSNSALYLRMSQGTATQLRRHPSAPQSPSSATNNRDHHRTQSSHASSNSSIERSPNLSASKHNPQSQPETSSNRYRYSAQQSISEKSSDELIKTLSESSSGFSTLDSTKASGYQNSLRRPGPPPLSHTSPNTKMMSPSLRQSASFSVGDRSVDTTPSLPDSGSATPKRYSDEAKNTAPWKKKGSFSSFVNSVLGSPRNVKISNPENPVHVTHVGFDNETGQFTVSLSYSRSFCQLYSSLPPSIRLTLFFGSLSFRYGHLEILAN